MQAARRSPRSVAVDEIQQEVGLPHVTAGIRALLQRGLITQGGKERPASWIRSLPNRCCPKLTRHAWTAIWEASVMAGWMDGVMASYLRLLVDRDVVVIRDGHPLCQAVVRHPPLSNH